MALHAKAQTSLRWLLAGAALAAAGACSDGLDFDMRGSFGSGLDTSAAARTATAQRPSADKRGIISYPNYQVAVARRGDTLGDVAARIEMPVADLAAYNGLRPEDTLRQGEVIALPYRVAEPSATTGGSGVVTAPEVDIASLAGNAIDSSAAAPHVDSEPLQPAPADAPKGETGFEPIRHKVQRGETAYTISRLYGVTPRALAEWNGLGSDFTIRENQILLIPPVVRTAPTTTPVARPESISPPGAGTVTPTPPSSSTPLPAPDPVVAKPASPDLGQSQTAAPKSQMGYPVEGKIISPYAKGKNNGIDIAADPGSPVKAAADGEVAAITTDADDVRIVVLRHDGNLMTVYYNVDQISVDKGRKVTRGQSLAKVPSENSFVHFEVRKGFDSVDPMPYLQ
ncbi:peptidoglycan DD-metalloendopeptidase family protein [Shimia sp.]|uniref:peptidoglycan DD-metalloendopeptidase family protein n=1 Tax=Shimia sp. TaxID=1954381 RepID=UPI0035674366